MILHTTSGGGRERQRRSAGRRSRKTCSLQSFLIIRHRAAMPAVRRRPTRRTATRLIGSCSSRRRRRTANDSPPPKKMRAIVYCIKIREGARERESGLRPAEGRQGRASAAGGCGPRGSQRAAIYLYIIWRKLCERHCVSSALRKVRKSDGRGGSARSDRAKSAVFSDRSASAAARARSLSPCLTFWYFWVKPKVR